MGFVCVYIGCVSLAREANIDPALLRLRPGLLLACFEPGWGDLSYRRRGGKGEGCLLAGNEVTIIADDGLRLEWERRLLSFFFLKKDYSML